MKAGTKVRVDMGRDYGRVGTIVRETEVGFAVMLDDGRVTDLPGFWLIDANANNGD